jgi:hypothetical protein
MMNSTFTCSYKIERECKIQFGPELEPLRIAPWHMSQQQQKRPNFKLKFDFGLEVELESFTPNG